MGPRSDLSHIMTPPDQRGAWWWLKEHRFAEQGVTSAAAMLDRASDDTARYLARQQLDLRLDHLEAVEDTCDEILGALREQLPPWVADACADRFMRGKPWATIAAARGMSVASVTTKCERAVHMLDKSGTPYPVPLKKPLRG